MMFVVVLTSLTSGTVLSCINDSDDGFYLIRILKSS